MTERERKLVFDNGEFIKWCVNNKKNDVTKYGGFELFLYANPNYLFLDLAEFVEEKFKIKLNWYEDIKCVLIIKKNVTKNCNSQIISELIKYKTKWTGLLNVYEWLIKEGKIK